MRESVERRELSLRTEDQVIAELNRLRLGYRKLRNWSLPQMSWHLATLIDKFLAPPINPTPTADETAKKIAFLDAMLSSRQSPPGFQAPPQLTPSPDLTDAEVDHFILSLQKMKAYPHKLVGMGPCGPVAIEEFRQVHFVHAEHHLGFLVPTTPRRAVRYGDIPAVIADVNHLRRGYTKCGNWTLPMISRHLTTVIDRTSRPASEPATPQQLQMAAMKERLLTIGAMPAQTIQAPETAVPPADCTEGDIDAFIGALDRLSNYSGPTASHRLFGPLSVEEHKKLVLVHSAHHLSFLNFKAE